MFIYQLDEDKYKVSLRSKNTADVSKIALKFGGGGHVRAAGFDISGSLEQIVDDVLREIEKELL